MKYKKEDLEKMIYINKMSYVAIGNHYGVSDTYIKKVAQNLGISLPGRKKFPEGWIPHNKGKKKINYCANCGKECDFFSKKYCSQECMGISNRTKTYDKYITAIKNNENIAENEAVRTYKRYILEEQNNCCSICGISNTWQDNSLTLILDHIDGNAANNKRENLRCICPNCDSQLPTFKSRNKNSARKERYLKNYKN